MEELSSYEQLFIKFTLVVMRRMPSRLGLYVEKHLQLLAGVDGVIHHRARSGPLDRRQGKAGGSWRLVAHRGGETVRRGPGGGVGGSESTLM